MPTRLSPTPDLEERARERLPTRLRSAFDVLDDRISGFMERYGIALLRIALALVFIWFGALKVADRSPVADLVADTAYFLPGDFVVHALGVWEIIIGIGLLIPVALRLVLLLFFLQMLGTFLTVAIHPGRVFDDDNPLLLTIAGEFIVKNLVLISAGLVIGSTVRRRRAQAAGGANASGGQAAQPASD